MEMRLNVLDLALKMQAHRPKVVCFVGKKIWDVYESVVVKTARPALVVQMVKVEKEVKVDMDQTSSERVELEKVEDTIVTVDDLHHPRRHEKRRNRHPSLSIGIHLVFSVFRTQKETDILTSGLRQVLPVSSGLL